jgi:hypothetical protein
MEKSMEKSGVKGKGKTMKASIQSNYNNTELHFSLIKSILLEMVSFFAIVIYFIAAYLFVKSNLSK